MFIEPKEPEENKPTKRKRKNSEKEDDIYTDVRRSAKGISYLSERQIAKLKFINVPFDQQYIFFK